jgi:HK97 family phage portal protein
MGAICDLLTRKTTRSTTSSPSQWLIDWVHGGTESSTGIAVSESRAMRYTPFWAAVRVITGTLSALPFIVYRRLSEDDRQRDRKHPVARLLQSRPNQYVDPITLIESRQAHALTYGNGYAEIQRDGRGRPVALWPLLPDRTQRKIDDAGTPYYEVRLATGGAVTLPDYNVLHIKGLGFDGYTGYNVVRYNREAIASGIAVREYGGRFFSGDGTPSGVLEHPGNLGADAMKNLSESWTATHSGLSNAHRLQILEEGMKWHETGIDPAQAQALEVQKFSVDECARIFNIPPHKIASMENATFSNIEEQNLDFVTSTMMYWFRKWEAEINYKLFTDRERDTMYCEILVDALLRGNIEARHKAYATGRQWGYYSINDILRMENMNTIGPEGDQHLDPLNMKPAGSAAPADGNDNARIAHQRLLAGQWRRITTKAAKGPPKGSNGEFWQRTRDHAGDVLADASIAYGATVGVDAAACRAALAGIIEQSINAETAVGIDDADTLADRTIASITELRGILQ